MWSTDTGEVLLRSEVAPLSPCARSCALSRDGSLAAVGFDDGSLKVRVQYGSKKVYVLCLLHGKLEATEW